MMARVVGLFLLTSFPVECFKKLGSVKPKQCKPGQHDCPSHFLCVAQKPDEHLYQCKCNRFLGFRGKYCRTLTLASYLHLVLCSVATVFCLRALLANFLLALELKETGRLRANSIGRTLLFNILCNLPLLAILVSNICELLELDPDQKFLRYYFEGCVAAQFLFFILSTLSVSVIWFIDGKKTAAARSGQKIHGIKCLENVLLVAMYIISLSAVAFVLLSFLFFLNPVRNVAILVAVLCIVISASFHFAGHQVLHNLEAANVDTSTRQGRNLAQISTHIRTTRKNIIRLTLGISVGFIGIAFTAPSHKPTYQGQNSLPRFLQGQIFHFVASMCGIGMIEHAVAYLRYGRRKQQHTQPSKSLLWRALMHQPFGAGQSFDQITSKATIELKGERVGQKEGGDTGLDGSSIVRECGGVSGDEEKGDDNDSEWPESLTVQQRQEQQRQEHLKHLHQHQEQHEQYSYTQKELLCPASSGWNESELLRTSEGESNLSSIVDGQGEVWMIGPHNLRFNLNGENTLNTRVVRVPFSPSGGMGDASSGCGDSGSHGVATADGGTRRAVRNFSSSSRGLSSVPSAGAHPFVPIILATLHTTESSRKSSLSILSLPPPSSMSNATTKAERTGKDSSKNSSKSAIEAGSPKLSSAGNRNSGGGGGRNKRVLDESAALASLAAADAAAGNEETRCRVRGIAVMDVGDGVLVNLDSDDGVDLEELGTLSQGSHAFVRCHGETHLRCTWHAFDFGFAGGHPLLANSDMVLMAGEVEVDAQGFVTRWLNKSGLYMPPRWAVGQSGLPFSTAWLYMHAHEVDALPPDRKATLLAEGSLQQLHYDGNATTADDKADDVADNNNATLTPSSSTAFYPSRDRACAAVSSPPPAAAAANACVNDQQGVIPAAAFSHANNSQVTSSISPVPQEDAATSATALSLCGDAVKGDTSQQAPIIYASSTDEVHSAQKLILEGDEVRVNGKATTTVDGDDVSSRTDHSGGLGLPDSSVRVDDPDLQASLFVAPAVAAAAAASNMVACLVPGRSVHAEDTWIMKLDDESVWMFSVSQSAYFTARQALARYHAFKHSLKIKIATHRSRGHHRPGRRIRDIRVQPMDGGDIYNTSALADAAAAAAAAKSVPLQDGCPSVLRTWDGAGSDECDGNGFDDFWGFDELEQKLSHIDIENAANGSLGWVTAVVDNRVDNESIGSGSSSRGRVQSESSMPGVSSFFRGGIAAGLSSGGNIYHQQHQTASATAGVATHPAALISPLRKGDASHLASVRGVVLPPLRDDAVLLPLKETAASFSHAHAPLTLPLHREVRHYDRDGGRIGGVRQRMGAAADVVGSLEAVAGSGISPPPSPTPTSPSASSFSRRSSAVSSGSSSSVKVKVAISELRRMKKDIERSGGQRETLEQGVMERKLLKSTLGFSKQLQLTDKGGRGGKKRGRKRVSR